MARVCARWRCSIITVLLIWEPLGKLSNENPRAFGQVATTELWLSTSFSNWEFGAIRLIHLTSAPIKSHHVRLSSLTILTGTILLNPDSFRVSHIQLCSDGLYQSDKAKKLNAIKWYSLAEMTLVAGAMCLRPCQPLLQKRTGPLFPPCPLGVTESPGLWTLQAVS